ncbi:MAG: DUF420 domain-containing protein [Candidatus Omnitrophica bacterium]|nr:DUF420 domain-containing protein [Candidatus Omnitrophota bacterium]MCB9767883.1 DUF420 domain-containing protein [Candidatus Omnitrophota bacterium]MCB9781876.1 DUF420 domain-containing protein [Candidatus Omnitrophota bacterium]
MSVYDLPAVNAFLNSAAAILLGTGYYFIKQKRIHAHKNCMISAFVVSALFLICYLVYHYYAGSKHFQGEGFVRYVYFTILLTHTVLAVVNLPLILTTFFRAYKQDWIRHRRIARWTFPIWMYVSVTGVIVYLMLYHLFPGPSA